jgi:hypothetical protein
MWWFLAACWAPGIGPTVDTATPPATDVVPLLPNGVGTQLVSTTDGGVAGWIDLTGPVELLGERYSSSLGTQLLVGWGPDGLTPAWVVQVQPPAARRYLGGSYAVVGPVTQLVPRADGGVEAWGVHDSEEPLVLGALRLEAAGTRVFRAVLDATGQVTSLVYVGAEDADPEYGTISAAVAHPDGSTTIFGNVSDLLGPGLGDQSPFAARIDPDGGVVWQTTYESTAWMGLNTVENAVAGPDGSVIAVGSWYLDLVLGDVELHQSELHAEAFVARFDADGSVPWVRTFQGPGAEVPCGVVATPQGFVVAGVTAGADAVLVDGEPLVSLSSHTRTWLTTWSESGTPIDMRFVAGWNLGAPLTRCLANDPRGGLLVLGSTDGAIATEAGERLEGWVVVARYDTSGNLLGWTPVSDEAPNHEYLAAYDLAVGQDRLLIGGRTWDGRTPTAVWSMPLP